IHKRMDETAFRVNRNARQALRDLAAELGFLSAGPRDVIALHTTVMKRLLPTLSRHRAEATAEEGRLALLELMGALLSYYRRQALGDTRPTTIPPGARPTEG
ncbi:MAG: hypothetical protein NZ518_11005, partial [Dehalococcoidia bacterium]|nr:hypothetical protein [Dehalococcoidia bacterium]